jgi:hypothetical protein
MSKKKQKMKVSVEKPAPSFWQNLSKTHLQIFGVSVIFLILLIYFSPLAIEGLSPTGTDVIGGIGKTHQINEFYEETGERALWNPYVFSGMPVYHRMSSKQFTIANIIGSFSNTSGRTAFFYYVIGALGMFFLTQFWGIPVWGSILASLAFVFMPHYEVLVQAGHYQKFRSIMIFPWVIFSFVYLLRKSNLWSLVFFTVAFSTQLRAKHYQIIFYVVLIMAFIGFSYAFQQIKDKKYAPIFKRTGLFVIAIFFSVLLSLQVLLPVREYAPYSIRGGTGEEGSTGLDFDYATGWSFSPKEIINLLIPNAYGGSSGITYNGNDVPQLKGREIPGYWGDMPFTEGGDYVGIITFIFAIIGIIYGFREKNRLIISFTVFILFAFLLSFGRHLPLLYGLFFKIIPMFNKFRIPSMILIAIYFVSACLAGFGFKTVLESGVENRKSMIKTVTGIAIFLIFVSLVPYLFKEGFSFIKAGESGRYSPQILNLIKDARYDLMKRDAMRLLVFALLGCGGILIFLRNWIKKPAVLILIGTLMLIDLISINNRFLKDLGRIDHLEQSYFRKTKTDQFILEDDSLFRIFSLEQNAFTNNNWAYYHQSAGGYSPAKLRIYQDVIESCFFKGWDKELPVNWNILNMLNTKYIIIPQQIMHPNLELVYTDSKKKYFTFKNKTMLPRAFFVENYEVIPEKQKRLERLNQKDFDPSITAILEEDLKLTLEKILSADVKVTLFQPNRIELDVNTDKKGLMVLSEIYYPPGWKATVDGEKTEVYKTNHILRSIIVPEGNHKVHFEFTPKSYIYSGWLSGILNTLLYSGLIIIGIISFLRKRKSG